MNPAATALIEAAKRRYDECLAKGVDEYLCAHARDQEVIMAEEDFPITERRSANRYGLTFAEDAGL